MKKRNTAFVFTDIHGCDKELRDLLKYWDGKGLLVCLGDSIDRGPNNYKALVRMVFLRKILGDRFIYIQGNHEDMFREYFEWMPDHEYTIETFLNNGGRETMYDIYEGLKLSEKMDFNTFLDSAAHGYGYMNDILPDVDDLLKSMVPYYVFGNTLLTHAGFDSKQEDWTKTSKGQFAWIRDHYKQPNKTGMVNIFGHTPTMLIDEKECKNGEIWYSPCGMYVGLDGGGVFADGRHNAVLIEEDGMILESYFVSKNFK